MAKLYDDVFGPVCLPYRDKNEMTQEEEKLWQMYFKDENEKVTKGYVKIQEKIKDISLDFQRIFKGISSRYQEWQWKNCD